MSAKTSRPGEIERKESSEELKLDKEKSSTFMNTLKEPFSKLANWMAVPDKKKKVYLFNEGSAKDRNLLGNKGANLCEMYRMSIPVPPGFVISTEICKLIKIGDISLPTPIVHSYMKRVKEIERITKRSFEVAAASGDSTAELSFPLLFSVRSGSPVSMPGMMDTILYLGMTDATAEIMSKISGARFAWDCYRRFLSSYGEVVCEIKKENFDSALNDLKAQKGYTLDSELTASDLQEICSCYKKMAPNIPMDPCVQLHNAVLAIFKSWWNPRATTYRELNSISHEIGTAVTVQSMVYGNFNNRSASGVLFTRNTTTGEKEAFGEYLTNASGEEVVQGVRSSKISPSNLDQFKLEYPKAWQLLEEIANKLERHYKSVQDIEFTIENDILWILQTRTAKCTPQASMKFAISFVEENLVTQREALLSLNAADFGNMLFSVIDPTLTSSTTLKDRLVGMGIGSVGGAVVGQVCFNLKQLQEFRAKSKHESLILVKTEIGCSDIALLQLCDGIITSTGGISSHASCVMRQMNKTAIIGCRSLIIDEKNCQILCGGKIIIKPGDIFTIDGLTSSVYLGSLPLIPAKATPESITLLAWADHYKSMRVFSNSDTVPEVEQALNLNVEGVGLVRTEHMFFDEGRLNPFQAMILSDSTKERAQILERLLPFQKQEFEKIFKIMSGKPVCIRLLDPPLHEFLPSSDSTSFAFEMQNIAEMLNIEAKVCIQRWESLQEKNPMLGLRGARLSLLFPEITEMQVKAIIGAQIDCQMQGCTVFPEIMIPLISTEKEVEIIANLINRAATDYCKAKNCDHHACTQYSIGIMLETPRALLRIESIVKTGLISFVSFGTNDLTSLLYGFSRDDSGLFINSYIEKGVFLRSPFESIDVKGVGSMMKSTIQIIKKTNSKVRVGVCGCQAGDPESIKFFEAIGVDYLSCASNQVMQAKIAAAQSHIEKERDSSWNLIASFNPFYDQ